MGGSQAPDGVDDVRLLCRERGVRLLQLQFTDILGVQKHVTVPAGRLEEALAGEVIVDGSATLGFVRLRESDIHLRPDPATVCVFPWKAEAGATARLICDLHDPDGSPFAEDPRHALRRACQALADRGWRCSVGAEPEFFIFRRDPTGAASTETRDLAGYFDMGPLDLGESLREEIVSMLLEMGFAVGSSHHEAAPGQHEIELSPQPCLAAADNLVTFRQTVRTLAALRGMHATFMPKPISDVNGSGLHLHLALRPVAEAGMPAQPPSHGLPPAAQQFMAGILAHAAAITAVTNPLVNSYKRLVPGYEAPTFATWSQRDRSPMIRVPARRDGTAALEVRSPDPACNPYLALAVLVHAGLDGILQRMEPPRPSGSAIHRMSAEERGQLGISSLPRELGEALAALEADDLVQGALGPEIATSFIEAKRIEWDYYRQQVHRWELDQYLSTF